MADYVTRFEEEEGVSRANFNARIDEVNAGLTAVRAGALPLTGGALTGDLTVKKAGSAPPRVNLNSNDENRYGAVYKNGSAASDYGTIILDVSDGEEARLTVSARQELPAKLQLAAKSADGTNKSYPIYGGHNKPTAADVGALPVSGGTLSGHLSLKNLQYPQVSLFTTTSESSGYITHSNNSTQLASKEENSEASNLRRLHIRNSAREANVSNAFWLEDVVDGTSSWHRIYGTHNKPTAADVGAAPSGFGLGAAAKSISGTDLLDTLKLGQSGWYKGNNVANAPDSGWYYFNIISDSANFAVVVAYSYGGPVYRIVYDDGALYAWRKLYDETNKPTAADVGISSGSAAAPSGLETGKIYLQYE